MPEFTCEFCNVRFARRLPYCGKRFCSLACFNKAKSTPPAERFWAKVDKNGPTPEHRPELGLCWLYTAGVMPNGYGHFWMDGRGHGAHRVAFYLTHGYWPKNACHHCDNPPCCNPAHIFDGSDLDNMRDKIAKGRLRVPAGSDHYFAKFSEQAIRNIRYACRSGESRGSIAARYGVNRSVISRIVAITTYRNVPEVPPS